MNGKVIPTSHAVVITPEIELLLENNPRENKISLFWGKWEKWDDKETALKREIRQELWLQESEYSYTFVWEDSPHEVSGNLFISHLFLIRIHSQATVNAILSHKSNAFLESEEQLKWYEEDRFIVEKEHFLARIRSALQLI